MKGVVISLLVLFVANLGIKVCASEVKASRIDNSLAGKKTATGKPYSPHKLTAASKSLPLGSKVKVKNVKTHKSTTVTVTDRGPYAKGRGLDLSLAAAKKIGLKGVAPVRVVKAPVRSHTSLHSRRTR